MMSNSSEPSEPEPEYISPTALAEYVSFNQCGRYAKHRVQKLETAVHHDRSDFTEAFEPLNILLSVAGDEFEEQVSADCAELARDWHCCERDEEQFRSDHELICEQVGKALSANEAWEDPIAMYQASIEGHISAWKVRGDADLIFIWSTASGAEIRVVDVKRASEEKTYHQIQAATYVDLLEKVLEAADEIDYSRVKFTAGIITLGCDFAPVTQKNVPKFDVEPRIMDVRRLLDNEGRLARAIDTSLKTVNHQLDQKCHGCPYNEACITDAFEDGSTRLLGLSPAQQAILAEHGIETIAELAAICGQTPSKKDWKPTRYKDVSFKYDTYRELTSIPGIGELLPHLVYRAESLLDTFQQNPEGVSDRPRNWLPGSGRCRLPDDEPSEDAPSDQKWMPGSMVRVYLNVQHDHLRDRLIQLSARVTATESETSPRRISRISEGAPDAEEASNKCERNLLHEFIGKLFEAIHDVANGIAYPNDEQLPPLHFYTYADRELTLLSDAFDRYPDCDRVQAFRSAIEGTERPDEMMVSPLLPEVQRHIILETPSPGLTHAYEELDPPAECYRKPRSVDEWSYIPPGESDAIHLRDVFGRRLFDIGVESKRRGEDGAQLNPEVDDSVEGVNVRMRYGADIPLGYIWAVVGRIDDEWAEKIEDSPLAVLELNSYRFRIAGQGDDPIRPADLRELGRHLCDAMEHVERALTYKDSRIRKEPYPLDELDVDTFEPPTLGTAADRYLRLEHWASREQEYETYRKFPEQRMLSGDSIPVHITEVEQIADNALRVDGRLRYDEFFNNGAERVKRACRRKGSDGSTSGSWMVANPLRPGQLDAAVTQPHEIERGVNATIETLDLNKDFVRFKVKNYWHEEGAYGRRHAKWTQEKSKARADTNRYLYFGPNEWVILDPQTDDITAGRIETALEHIDTNAFHGLLEGIRTGDNPAPIPQLISHRGGEDWLAGFASWIKREIGPQTLPGSKQREFITASKSQLVGLQGPPGTGKTAGAMAPALLARVYAAARSGLSLNGLITAPSNTAIDELLRKTAAQVRKAQDNGPFAKYNIDIELVRITDDKPDDAPKNVRYVSYNNPDDTVLIQELDARLRTETTGTQVPRKEDTNVENEVPTSSERQFSIQEFGLSTNVEDESRPATPQTLVFATVGRAWRFIKEITPGSSPDDREIASQELWHLLAIDEASMMELPHALLAGSALHPTGQVLVGGDHRQLPPVQKYDWSDVRRRDIRSAASYLSMLDYLRLLRGEEVLDEDHREQFDFNGNPNDVQIPLKRLKTTYRFGSTIADLTQQTIYYKDEIRYQSGRDPEPLPSSSKNPPEPLRPIFNPESAVVLITYENNGRYQQWNPIESSLTRCIISQTHPRISAGVVTPHNAQRGRIQTELSNLALPSQSAKPNGETEGDTEREVQVETVNRFQGGERDLMILSATVSDPDYIEAESDFLLQENRINVSLTRHRDQLIVIAPQSILGYIPSDPDLYNHACIWKHLSRMLGEAPTVAADPTWQGSLRDVIEACDQESIAGDSNLSGELDAPIWMYET